MSQRIFYFGYSSSQFNNRVEHHWSWKVIGLEMLGISQAVGRVFRRERPQYWWMYVMVVSVASRASLKGTTNTG